MMFNSSRSEVNKFFGPYVNRSGAKPREFEQKKILIYIVDDVRAVAW